MFPKLMKKKVSKQEMEQEESLKLEDIMQKMNAQMGLQSFSEKDVEAEYNAILAEINGTLEIDAADALVVEEIDVITEEDGISSGDVAKLLADCLVDDAHRESGIEVTDNDLNDPALIAELSLLGFKEETTSKSLEREVQNTKNLALKLKREGDLPGAIEAIRRLHQLEAQLASPRTCGEIHKERKVPGHVLSTDSVVDELDPTCFEVTEDDMTDASYDIELSHFSGKSVHALAPQDAHVKCKQDLPVVAEQQKPSIEQDQTRSTIVVEQPLPKVSIKDEIDALKIHALQLKREGKVSEAIAVMKELKILENGTSKNKGTEMVKEQEQERQRQIKFSELENLLVQHANNAMQQAKKYINDDREKAAELVNLRKRYVADLDRLKKARNTPYQLPPTFTLQVNEKKVEVILPDVQLSELELSIQSVTGLSQYKSKNIYVKYHTGFPSQSAHEGITATVHGGPDFILNETRRLPLSRKKSTVATFEIRKASFEVWRVRSFLRGQEFIGKATLELNPLLNCCEVKPSLPLLDLNRKHIGGHVQVHIRLRTPIKEAQWRVEKHQEVVVSTYPPLDLVTEKDQHNFKISETKLSQSFVEEETVADVPSVSDLSIDLDDPDLIVSYDVMNFELEQIEAKLGSGMDSSEEMDHVSTFKEALELKKQFLEFEMQSGQLGLVAYLQRLKDRLLVDKNLAVSLNREGKKQDALKIFRRVKIMTSEIEGAEGVRSSLEPSSSMDEDRMTEGEKDRENERRRE